MIVQVKFTYFRLGKTLEKQKKIIEHQWKKQSKTLTLLKLDVQKLTIKSVIPEEN